MVVSGFVVEPPRYYLPTYRIGPFQTRHVATNAAVSEYGNGTDKYLSDRFGHDNFAFTISGRAAIHDALQLLSLKPQDCVTIITTTQNVYISRCVTETIERTCQWARVVQQNTKAILVNHEFGFPYEELQALRRYNVPVIEDLAHSFLSQNREGNVGKVGDISILSLPKFFPMQIGGVLVCNNHRFTAAESTSPDVGNYVRSVVSSYLKDLEGMRRTRVANWCYLAERFAALGMTSHFKLRPTYTPGVFMFNVPDGINLSNLKEYAISNGIECSVFYGRNAFFLPVHQNLSTGDLDFFFEVVKAFICSAPRSEGM